MVLSHQNVFPVLQPDLGFDNMQEDIISGLRALAWKLRTSVQQFAQVNQVLEREEERAELIRGVPIAHEEVVIA